MIFLYGVGVLVEGVGRGLNGTLLHFLEDLDQVTFHLRVTLHSTTRAQLLFLLCGFMMIPSGSRLDRLRMLLLLRVIKHEDFLIRGGVLEL
jgi:hypothetical protein